MIQKKNLSVYCVGSEDIRKVLHGQTEKRFTTINVGKTKEGGGVIQSTTI